MEQRKESLPFYHRAAWKRARDAALRRDCGMCQDCMAAYRAGYGFKPRRAQLVHHIIPLEERPDLGLTLSNLVSLCTECHAKRHPEKGRKGGPEGTAQRAAAPEERRHRMRVIKV